ncbi:hypothetical protein O3P69_001433 [Scylla paramamosain]|uniref:Uncharacterized protein n=1 Tax=Scylla paramamosain TaxID=85552 RepID=A0AAW0V1R1_SCYPA
MAACRALPSRRSLLPRQDHVAAADPARDSGPANSHPLLRLSVVSSPADSLLNAIPERHEDRLERKGDQRDEKSCSSEVFGERERRRSGGRLKSTGLASVCQVRREKPWRASPLSLSYANIRPANRLTSMYRPSRTVSLVWAWVWAWCGVPAGVLGAAAIPPGLTTEAHIFTGPTTTTPPPPAPPEDFTVTYKDVFASFVHLTFSYNATFNLTKVTVIYKDPHDSSRHYITLKTVANGGDFDPTSLYEPASGRLGFEFRLGGLYRLRRYNLRADGIPRPHPHGRHQLHFPHRGR